jgi:hypothetical protein
MDNAKAALIDEIQRNWRKYEEIVDPDAEFGTEIAELLSDDQDDKGGRVRDLHQHYLEHCADQAMANNIWYGMWGQLKRAAGLREPSHIDNEPEGLPTGWKDAA